MTTSSQGLKTESENGQVVRWVLPRMALRVLLIEADDSTRQIIAALLRKSNYTVSTVPDGLKAWEILKGKPHNIDLVLTEMELPSISGFALLTLIMEHQICKNIPVIMMSSEDSISSVYKCMLRGAADYLVKPIRRNELRNLWQHVWRRRSVSINGGNFPRDESIGQDKVEATSENNAASNHSTGRLACGRRNKEPTEKQSDAQSSCTKPGTEAESAGIETMQEFSDLMKGKSQTSESQMHDAHANLNHNLLMHDANAHKGVELESQRTDTLVESPREAIDFMTAFSKNCDFSSINSTSKCDSSPHLNLSLRRCNPNVFENNVTQERPVLWNPNSSAFTRYSSRLSQPLNSTMTSISNQKKECGTNFLTMSSNIISEYNSGTSSPTLTRHMIPLTIGATDQSKQTEVAVSCMKQRECPVPVSSKSITTNSQCDGYISLKSSISPVPTPSSANQKEPTFLETPFRHSCFASSINQSTNQPLHKPDQTLDSIEDKGRISPTTNQSGTGSSCNGSLDQLNGMAYGSSGASNSNVDQAATVQTTERTNDEDFPGLAGNPHRSSQREAALNKFRLKRKERCFVKKVRYESRKKLAEQRPRVKGQFVRRPQVDHPTQIQAELRYDD